MVDCQVLVTYYCLASVYSGAAGYVVLNDHLDILVMAGALKYWKIVIRASLGGIDIMWLLSAYFANWLVDNLLTEAL